MAAQHGHLEKSSWIQVSLCSKTLASEIVHSVRQTLGIVAVMQLFALLAPSGSHLDKVRRQIPCIYALLSQQSLGSYMLINKLNLDVLQKST